MLPEDRPQAIGDQEVGADRTAAVLGGDAQQAEPLVGEHALQRDDRVARRAAIELDLGQGQAGGESIAGRPRGRGRRLEACRRPTPVLLQPRLAAELHQQAEPVVPRRVEQGHAVDQLGGTGLADRVAERLQGQLVVPVASAAWASRK